MSSLSGKVAIVTGAARGIGASIAVGLAKEGANVVVNYVSPSSKPLAEKVAQEAESYGSKALIVQANVGSLSDINKLVKQTVAQFGKIDILVNNGGVLEFANVGDITPESFTRVPSSSYGRRRSYHQCIEFNLINYLDKKIKFTDSEVIGNTWVIFFAAHETTADTLAANPKEQEILYKEVNKTCAALVEALRMYPAGKVLIRGVTEDTVLQVSQIEKNGVRREQSMHFSKGSILMYNATSNDAYTAFSIGPRTCIVCKFSLIEGVCWIAHFMKNFMVEPLLAEGEDLAGWKKRTLDKGKFKLSFSIGGAPLTFKRR
ncbi:NAD(P)-binding protein [Serendipita vermifera]|nr:NAD(P)-binding protein [Serendipita vermifera]